METYKNTNKIKEYLDFKGFTILLDICYGDECFIGGIKRHEIGYYLFKIETHELRKGLYISEEKICKSGTDILINLNKMINE